MEKSNSVEQFSDWSQNITLLQSLIIELIEAKSINTIRQSMVEKLMRIKNIHGAGFYEIDLPMGISKLVCYKGFEEEFIQKVEYLPLSLNVIEKIQSTGEIVEFLTTSGAENREDLLPGKKMYFCPLMSERELIGFVVLTTPAEKCLSPAQIEFLQGACQICCSIIKRQLHYEALLASNELIKGIVNSAPMGILLIDQDAIVVYENPAMSKIIKSNENDPSSMIGRKITSISAKHSAVFVDALNDLLSGKSFYGLEIEYQNSIGQDYLLEFHGAPRKGAANQVIGAVLMCLDMTSYKVMESQLRQAQKMEAIGTLAGGIAHDFNNLLTGILGNVELALMRMESGSDVKGNLDSILLSSKRASELTSQLLAFGRREMEQPRPLDMRQSINEAILIIKRTIDPLISLNIRDKALNHTIYGDPGQMNQTLINLMINACDAMPNGGAIDIISDNVLIDEDYCLLNPEAVPGYYYRLTIRDTGIGIPAQNLHKIFEPFFTTKELGKGTGLGLAMVYGIVKSHKGWIDVESEINIGTAFIIYLPTTEEAIKEQEQEEVIEIKPGSETVLFVDDEESVRNFGEELLKCFGYKVISACNGMEAIACYRQAADNIDLVILDLSMPHKSGKETLKELMEINPEVKVIISSGYDKTGPVASLLEMGAKSFVQKPYQIDKMLREIRRTIDNL